MPTFVAELSEELVNYLQGEKIVTLITTHHQTKQPHMSAISWVVAQPGGQQMKFALGHKGESVDNLLANPKVTLGVIGLGGYFAIQGTARVSEVIELTMKYRVITVDVDSVTDVMFYGGKVTVEPDYIKTYNPDLAAKIDQEVYELLRG